MQDEHLLYDVAPQQHQHRTASTRWYILFVFSMFSFNQCLVWFTFSSVKSNKIKAYYGDHMTDEVIALLLNWGPIFGIAFFPIQTWMLTRSSGFKNAAQLGAVLVFAGSMIRMVPTWAGQEFRQQHGAALVFLHAGQILNAAAGPLCMGTESKLSCIWFPENERATATATAVTANGVGTTMGFLLGPYIASSADSVATLLYVEMGLASIPFLCCMIHFPAAPPTPPSAAAAAAETTSANYMEGHSKPKEGLTYWEGLGLAMQSSSFVMLVLAAGVLAGVSSAWQSQLQSIIGYDGETVAWLGFGNGIAGNIGAICVGYISDKFLQRQFKRTILGLLGVQLIVIVWFTLSLPVFDSTMGVIPHSIGSIAVAIVIIGFTQSATSPIFYELCAELTYPIPEGTSAGILALIWNTAALVVIFLSPVLNSKWMNMIMALTVALVIGMLTCVKEAYNRPQDGEVSRIHSTDETKNPLHCQQRPAA